MVSIKRGIMIPRLFGLLVATLIGVGSAVPCRAAPLNEIRVGTPALVNFTFLPLYLGQQKGFFAKYGLDLKITGFQNGTLMNQAVVSGDIDMTDGAGIDMIFTAKGVPAIAVAATAGPPVYSCLIVPYDSPIKSADDLKGKKVAVASSASLSNWLMRRLMEEKHWPSNSITLVSIGASPSAYTAALKTHQVDAALQSPALAFTLEERKEGRMVFSAGDIAPVFMSNAIFASDRIAHEHPDEVRAFIKGWFDTVEFMRMHKDETVEFSRSLNHYDGTVASREYDTIMPMFLTKGNFDPAALAVLRESFIEMRLVDSPPDMSKLYTEKFLAQQ